MYLHSGGLVLDSPHGQEKGSSQKIEEAEAGGEKSESQSEGFADQGKGEDIRVRQSKSDDKNFRVRQSEVRGEGQLREQDRSEVESSCGEDETDREGDDRCEGAHCAA